MTFQAEIIAVFDKKDPHIVAVLPAIEAEDRDLVFDSDAVQEQIDQSRYQRFIVNIHSNIHFGGDFLRYEVEKSKRRSTLKN